jgi:hypothetical protein
MSFDVVSLFPNIEVHDGINTVAKMVPPHQFLLVLDLLKIVMENNYFACLGKLWHQIYGTAQGSPVSPPYANLYLCDLESKVAELCVGAVPLIFKRLMDDGFGIFGSIQELESWIACYPMGYNSIKPRIKITWKSSTNSMQVLDIIIWKDLTYEGDLVPIRVTTLAPVQTPIAHQPLGSSSRNFMGPKVHVLATFWHHPHLHWVCGWLAMASQSWGLLPDNPDIGKSCIPWLVRHR